jgi:ankyrin repeat protein
MELITYLLDMNVIPVVQDGRGYTPLHWACAHNSVEMAELLLKPQYRAKAMVDMVNDSGYPPHVLIDTYHGGEEGRALWALMLEHGASTDLFQQLYKSVSAATIARVNKEDGRIAHTAEEKAAKKEEEFDKKEAHMLAVAHGRIDDDLTEL